MKIVCSDEEKILVGVSVKYIRLFCCVIMKIIRKLMIEKNGGRKEKCCCLDVKKIKKRSFTHKKKRISCH